MAEDDIPILQNSPEHVDDENDNVSPLRSASKALHDDDLPKKLPSLPVEFLDLPVDHKPLILVDSCVWEQENFLGLDVKNQSSSTCAKDDYPGAPETDTPSNPPANGPLNDLQSDEDETEDSLETAEAEKGDAAVPGEGTAEPEASNTDDEEDGPSDQLVVDYASKSAGALIIEKSSSIKGTSNLLNGDKDKYAIAPCEDKKKVVIGLSEDILVKQVKLANYERYSSQVETFQILGSQSMGNWVDLGTYKAEDKYGEQMFQLNEPSWARYLKFRFISHYGSEHYCTISQIKVHGSTMLQGFHEQWKESEEETKQILKEVDGEDANAGVTETIETSTIDEKEPVKEAEPDTSAKAEDTKESTESALSETLADEVDGDGMPATTASDDEVTPDSSLQDEPSAQDSADGDGESRQNANITNSSTELNDDQVSQKVTGIKEETKATPGTPSSVSSEETELPGHSKVSSSQASHLSDENERLEQPEHDAGDESKPDPAVLPGQVTHAVASAVKNVVAEASDAIKTIKDAPTMSDALQGLQQKLKTTIGNSESDIVDARVDQPNDSILEEGSEALAKQSELKQPAADSSGSEEIIVEGKDVNKDASELSGLSQDQRKEEPSQDTAEQQNTQQEASKLEGHPSEADTETIEEKATAAEHITDASANNEIPVKATSEAAPNNDLLAALNEITKRFPNAVCLKGLNYQDFKVKTLAARKGASPDAGGQINNNGAAGNPGRMEPIFKMLTDEIKSLQISHSVQDQYVKALVSCYQHVLVEMLKELDEVHVRQEKRLSDLELAFQNMQSRSWISSLQDLFAGVAGIVSFGTVLFAGFVSSLLEENLIDSSRNMLAGFVVVLFLATPVILMSRYRSIKEEKRALKSASGQKTSLPTTPTLIEVSDADDEPGLRTPPSTSRKRKTETPGATVPVPVVEYK